MAKEEKTKRFSATELPPEFLWTDKPVGLSPHVGQIIVIGLTHIGGLYYLLYLWPFGHVPFWTSAFWSTYAYIGGLGITAGVHRLWTHRAYKANFPLRVILMLLQTSIMQFPIFKWAREHRLHHKYVDTNADPYNAARGFWFSHFTWLFQPHHPDYLAKLKTIDVQDLIDDPIVRFQSKYYWPLIFVTYFATPIYLCHLLFPEMTFVQLFLGNVARHLIQLHFAFTINSVAHYWGDRPYDKNFTPVDNKVFSLLFLGEGCHNYHHTFPWDYRCPEFGFKYNTCTLFIHFFASIGWAWDLKTVSHKTLVTRINRTGDGSHPLHGKTLTETQGPLPKHYWGWGDTNVGKQEMELTETLYPSKSPRG